MTSTQSSHSSATRASAPHESHYNLRDRRYPRRGLLLWIRTGLLLCWTVIGGYLVTVVLNLIQLVANNPSAIADHAAVMHALLLPGAPTGAGYAVAVYAPIAMVFLLLVGGCTWAVRDLTYERKLDSLRDAQVVAIRVTETEDEITRTRRGISSASLLVVPIEGNTPATRTPLIHGMIAIGRDTDNDITISDPAVARHHLLLNREGMQWRATVLPSESPLFVNGQQQQQVLLRDGDQMVIGLTILRFEAPLPPGQTLAYDHAPRLVVACAAARFAAPLREAQVTLGRAPDCGIVVPSLIVGKYHAVLNRIADGSFAIEDHGSRNGVRFGGRRFTSHTYRNGEMVTIGERSGIEVVTLTYDDTPPFSEQVTAEITGVTIPLPEPTTDHSIQ